MYVPDLQPYRHECRNEAAAKCKSELLAAGDYAIVEDGDGIVKGTSGLCFVGGMLFCNAANDVARQKSRMVYHRPGSTIEMIRS